MKTREEIMQERDASLAQLDSNYRSRQNEVGEELKNIKEQASEKDKKGENIDGEKRDMLN